MAANGIDTVSPRRRVELGLVHVPEGKRLFPRMSVRENLELGAYLRGDATSRGDAEAMCERRFPILGARRRQAAGSLSGGEQQILAVAHAAEAAAGGDDERRPGATDGARAVAVAHAARDPP